MSKARKRTRTSLAFRLHPGIDGTLTYVPEGRTASLFAEWFLALDSRARQLVDDAVARMRLGNPGDCKRVGAGVVERRIDSGPGYRIYFGRDGDKLILLLAGSTKRRQQKAIATAQELWREYKQRKRKGD